MEELTNQSTRYLPEKRPVLANLNPPSQLAVILSLVVIGILLFSAMGIFIGFLMLGVSDIEQLNFSQHLDNPAVVNVLKVIQALSAIGGFIIPALVFSFLASAKAIAYLKLNKLPSPFTLLLTVVLTFSIGPLINFFAEINSHMQLPQFMAGIEQWMRSSEEEAARITTAFLKMNGLTDLLINLIIVAFLAALGEELLFRGVIQTILNKWTKHSHIAIWVTAVLFSAFHMQFYGFLPRMLLGALLGYLLQWSNSIWLPILAHFVNNATAVIASYFIQHGSFPKDIETVGSSDKDWVIIISSFALMVLLLRYIYKATSHKTATPFP